MRVALGFLALMVAIAAQAGLPAVAEAKPTPAPVSPMPRLGAGSAVLMDWQTGQVLYEKDARRRRDPASTTKVLTALLVLERARLDDKVTISRRAAATPGSSMRIRQGEVYSVHDLLHGLLLRSGNDAAVALAEHVSGSVAAFAQEMNQRAVAIGARQSHFVNPNGLTEPDHYSTAYDLALITRQALRHPWFAEVVSLRQQPLTYEELDRDVVLSNTNRLLQLMPEADGVKTGTTAAAGACLIASATRDDHKLVSVVLHAGNRWSDSARLLEWGYANYRLAYLGRKGEVITSAPVSKGKSRRVAVTLGDDLAVVVPRSLVESPRLELQVGPALMAPLQAGAEVGSARAFLGSEPLAEVALVAGASVPERSLLDAVVQSLVGALRLLLEFGIL